MERVILLGGPCSGRRLDVEPGTPALTALDDLDDGHVYERTAEVQDVDQDVRRTVFRPARFEAP